MSYVRKAGFDEAVSLTEARCLARLSVADCIELCDISERTWYRWLRDGAPRWAIRLVESQIATLDRFGWKGWEIRKGALYCNQLSHRYHWEPVNLLLPLYNPRASDLAWSGVTDNLSSLERARAARQSPITPEIPPDQTGEAPPTSAYNI